MLVFPTKLRISVVASNFARMWQAGGYSDLDDLELRQRGAHLSARLPFLYLIFALTALLVATSFYTSVNLVQGVLVPAIYIIICLSRALYWQEKKVRQRDIAKVRKDIAKLQYVGPAIILIAISWIISMYPEADFVQQGVVHYVIAIMITSGMLTLIDTPRTAIIGGLAASIPFCVALFTYGSSVHVFTAICQICVTLLLVVIGLQYYLDLGKMLASEKELKERQVTLQKNAADLEILSSTDPLTGILNRRAIFAIAEEEIIDTSKPGPWLALLDLDEFKQINDNYGHHVGDHVLQVVAERICCEQKVTNVGRIGGDEFFFLLSGEESAEDALKIATRLANYIAEPFEMNGLQLQPLVSIGLRKTARMSLSDCLERADFALFKAKESNTLVALFDAEQEKELLHKNKVAAAFKVADLNREIEVEFQPIFDFDTKKILSVEALARWKRNETSVIMPDIFIDLAESTGRIAEITDCMIEKALRFASGWPGEVGVQINLSPQDLLRDNLVEHVAASIKKADVEAQRVTFEVTETMLVTNPSKVAPTIAHIRALGCKVALDDFGTGYSSLAYLDRFPFDQIKLDREFARKLAPEAPSAAVASTVFMLSQQLGADCTIEGIETEEQALIARRIGIRRMQGFFFARPMKHKRLLEMFHASSIPEKNETRLIGSMG